MHMYCIEDEQGDTCDCDCDDAEGSHEHCAGCDCVLRWDESEKYCASCEKLQEDAA
jgi:hypothetical protein